MYVGKRRQQKEIADGKRQEKNTITYCKFSAKQYTISFPETESKHIPLLPTQRDFNQRIVIKYYSSIWPGFEDMDLWLYMFFIPLVFNLEQNLSCMDGKITFLL